ncbi:MAG: hypothetical protein H8E31_12230 [Planctomycetes bacterium]|nr:hypothetical protein [Planctomycetota bacterium]
MSFLRAASPGSGGTIRLLWLPVLTALALGMPFLGNAISVFGVDNRIASIGLSVVVFLVAIVLPGNRMTFSFRLVGLIAFFLLTAFSATGKQVEQLFVLPEADFRYSDEALRLLFIGPIAFSILAYLVSFIFREDRAHRAFHRTALGLAVAAVGLLILNWSAFTSGWMVLSDARRGISGNDMAFSTISASLLILHGFFCTWMLVGNRVLRTGLLVVFAISIILLLQRTHMVLLLLPPVMSTFGELRPSRLPIRVAILTGMLLAGYWAIGNLDLFGNANLYFRGFAEAGDTRLAEIQLAWGTFLERPAGLGLGEFSHISRSHFGYPHNIFIEAFVEEGLLAGLLLLLLTGSGVARVFADYSRCSAPGKVTRLLFLAVLFQGMKSSSIPTSTHFFFLLVLLLCLPPASPDRAPLPQGR